MRARGESIRVEAAHVPPRGSHCMTVLASSRLKLFQFPLIETPDLLPRPFVENVPCDDAHFDRCIKPVSVGLGRPGVWIVLVDDPFIPTKGYGELLFLADPEHAAAREKFQI